MHFPGHIRDAFLDWIDNGQPETATVEVDYKPTQWPARQLLGRLAHCTDILPGEACADLDIPRGSTYASAAQRLLWNMKQSDTAVRPESKYQEHVTAVRAMLVERERQASERWAQVLTDATEVDAERRRQSQAHTDAMVNVFMRSNEKRTVRIMYVEDPDPKPRTVSVRVIQQPDERAVVDLDEPE